MNHQACLKHQALSIKVSSRYQGMGWGGVGGGRLWAWFPRAPANLAQLASQDLLSGLAPSDPRPGLGSAAAAVLPYASWVFMDAMDINGFPWICMDIHEYPWISINVHACQFDINGFQLMP